MQPTLSQIALQYPAAVPVLEKYNLDYCCHGKQTLEESCKDDVEKYNRVQEVLEKITTRETGNPVVFEIMELRILISHIVNKHHSYVRESMPVILAHLTKVAAKHGEGHPELKQVIKLFEKLADEMTLHMKKEEFVLFPAIGQMEKIRSSGNEVESKFAIEAPVRMMENEHEEAGNIMKEICELTSNYTPPSNACTTYQVMLKELQEFQGDLHQHVNLENNILFPRALKMQQDLLQAARH